MGVAERSEIGHAIPVPVERLVLWPTRLAGDAPLRSDVRCCKDTHRKCDVKTEQSMNRAHHRRTLEATAKAAPHDASIVIVACSRRYDQARRVRGRLWLWPQNI